MKDEQAREAAEAARVIASNARGLAQILEASIDALVKRLNRNGEWEIHRYCALAERVKVMEITAQVANPEPSRYEPWTRLEREKGERINAEIMRVVHGPDGINEQSENQRLKALLAAAEARATAAEEKAERINLILDGIDGHGRSGGGSCDWQCTEESTGWRMVLQSDIDKDPENWYAKDGDWLPVCSKHQPEYEDLQAQLEQLRAALLAVANIAHFAWFDPETEREAFEMIEERARATLEETK